ncbi:MAG TPA: PKD domain-containing protein [Phycisphaerae bacterium]|jgi:PKD repeat protein
MHPRIPFVFLIVLLAIAGGAPRTLKAELLGDGWTYRRPLAFRQGLSDAPGDNMAWAEFYANGTQLPDGADIRVTSGDKIVMPHKLMQVSRDSDFIRIAFATKSDGPYFVWWGNPKAEKPAKELEIRRGIHLEISRMPAGRGGPAALDAPGGPVMASFQLPEISLGYDPLGDERGVLLHYTGMFKVERPVSVQMAFTLTEQGLLSIDGKEIDRQRGGLRGQVRQPIPVELTAGWHALDVKQTSQNAGNTVMALVWERPGEKAYTPIPAAIFAPAAHAIAGPLEKIGAPACADMTVDGAGEGFLPPSFYAQRYVFEAQYPNSVRATFHWEFGDGQTFTGLKKVSHIFLSPGIYDVTLKLDSATGAAANPALSTTLRLQVKDRMYEKFPHPQEDPPTTVKVILHDYKPDKLPAEQALRGMMFFESLNDDDDQMVWGHAWLAGKDSVTPGDSLVFEETFDLARMEIERKQFKEAAESFKLASAKQIGMETRMNLMRHEVMTLCDYVDDPDAAVKEAQDWIRRVGTGGNNRQQIDTVQSALAYALIAKGDSKGAKAAIDAAVAANWTPSARGGVGADAFNQRQVRQGVLTRNVEEYIRTKDINTALTLLNQWELEFPDSIWEGFTRTLRAKLAAAEGRNLVAARMALEHARANPDGFYAAELLYRAAENFKLGGERDQAQAAMDLLATKYPESPYARDAVK